MATTEERLAALEAQLAALLGSGEEPSGYYTSKYSGEELDALLDKVAAMEGSK